jgi:hypothetical protein
MVSPAGTAVRKATRNIKGEKGGKKREREEETEIIRQL